MNELLFFSHILFIIFFTLIALKTGKEMLSACICLQIVLSNLFVTKEITLFGLNVTSCEAYTVGAFLSLNLLQEFFTKKAVRKALWACLFCMAFVVIISQLHICYIPSEFDNTHLAFEQILSRTPRIFLASIASYFIALFLDLKLFQRIKDKWPQRPLWLRMLSTTFISQFIDTVIFAFLGLFGIVHNIWHIIAMAYTIKIITTLALTPMTLIAKRLASPPTYETS